MKALALLGISQVADVGATAFALGRGATEMFPVPRFLLENGGFASLILIKAAFFIFAALIVVRATRYGARHMGRVNRLVVALAVLFLAVAAFNLVSWI